MNPYGYLVCFLAGILLDAWAFHRGVRKGYFLALDHVANEAFHDRKGWLIAHDPPRTTKQIVEKLRNDPW